ncbi:MAG: hypothetical protein AB7V18_12105 [Pyrinomonadaceae bacterium]
MFRFFFVIFGVGVLGTWNLQTQNADACSVGEQDRCKPCLRTTDNPNKRIENKWPDVTELEIEKTEVVLPLPEGSPPAYLDYSQSLILKVKTTSVDPEGDLVKNYYTVTGGRIIGDGANVFWNLHKVRPGTYTITASVDDGCGVCGAKITRTITVRENEAMPKCVCNKIRIGQRGEKSEIKPVATNGRVFEVSLTGPEPDGLLFNWTLSEGTIISGQGTRSIRVEPSEDPRGRPVSVTVEVIGLDPNCECPTTATRNLRY